MWKFSGAVTRGSWIRPVFLPRLAYQTSRALGPFLAALLLPLSFVQSVGRAAETGQAEFFESKIRPLLIENCHTCHTGVQSGGLRLDSLDTVLKGGNSGAAIILGNPDKSLLIQVVSHTHDRLRMPPTGKLEPHEIEYLKDWIRAGAAWPESREEFFEKRIHPLLEENCLACHRENPQGGLRLDSGAAILLGGHSGPSLIPGNPEESLIIQAVRYEDEGLQMPPTGRLSDEAIADLTEWVADGSVWSDTGAEQLEPYEISEQHRNFWSFQAVSQPTVPVVDDPRWKESPVDRFIFTKLAEKGLTPGQRADKRGLIRRATYDLAGLPPTPDEIEDFLADDSPKAFEKVVERLLGSRHYGERWGRHWLDIVRYADTAGDSGDFPIPEAYKYRNYVIDSFNKDKPYDALTREQIAGDQLPYESDEERWEQTVGTGYIAISRRIGVSPDNLRHITIEDTLDNLGKTFLGLTLGCARCHNHKFDPIPTADYYALYGIFDSSVYPFPGSEHKPHRKDFVYRLGKEESDKILEPYRERLDVWNKKEREKFDEYNAPQKKKIEDPTRSRLIIWQELLGVREQHRQVAETFPKLEIAYAMQEWEPHDVRIQKAGDPKALGPEVQRGFLQILGGQKLPADAKGSGRKELAEWIADPKNPLTARVMVNRIWHYHFGRGIVRTTSDFGIRGSPPTHPELLDYLASYFVNGGWSIKDMHRLIMLSETYRLASTDVPSNSAVDPQNELLWRQNRRRLDAESIRDSILMFSGNLDRSPGERHPFPHHLTYFYRQHEPFNERYPANLRTIYVMQQRFEKNAYLDLFDGPDGNLPLDQRKSSITTLQALFLMNSEFMHQQSDAIAERLLARADSVPERTEWACQTIFGRPASQEEVARTEEYLASVRRQLDADCESERCTQGAWAGFLRAMLSSNESIFVD